MVKLLCFSLMISELVVGKFKAKIFSLKRRKTTTTNLGTISNLSLLGRTITAVAIIQTEGGGASDGEPPPPPPTVFPTFIGGGLSKCELQYKVGSARASFLTTSQHSDDQSISGGWYRKYVSVSDSMGYSSSLVLPLTRGAVTIHGTEALANTNAAMCRPSRFWISPRFRFLSTQWVLDDSWKLISL